MCLSWGGDLDWAHLSLVPEGRYLFTFICYLASLTFHDTAEDIRDGIVSIPIN